MQAVFALMQYVTNAEEARHLQEKFLSGIT